jgi:hypothetical protein
MRKLLLPLLLIGLIAGTPVLARGDHWDHEYSVKAEETIQKSFAMPAGGQKSLEIDNVFGSIEVTGGSSNEIRMVIEKTIRAESNDSLERAKKEVTLDVDQHEGALRLYVDGPFRCHCDDCCRGNGSSSSDCSGSHESRGYIVEMNFKLQVPSEIDVRVKTVNHGGVKVSNVSGDFSVHNVNGRIEMNSVAGSGTAATVNGPVTVSFRQNPGKNSAFRTINGDVELRFAGGLSADFRLKNFHGGIYTDFPVTALPARAVSEEHRDGKLILRADRSAGARIGAGGPEIQIENLNGDIRILENHE